MKICVVGTGYVGVVTAACFAELGNSVTCVDVVREKVEMVAKGRSPVFEPGVDELLKRAVKAKRLKATVDLARAVKESGVSFICVGTPSKEDGSTDLSYVFEAAKGIGKALRGKKPFHVVIVKSTVPPGTSEKAARIVAEESGKKAGRGFGVCMNPEFLKEGSAVEDFMEPDRIVVGGQGAKERKIVLSLYSRMKAPVLETDLRTAEMIKYASNAFLASKVSFINEIANICERLGIDVYSVADGIGYDQRIGRRFLNAGAGWGGSCFGKDVKSLIFTSKGVGYRPELLEAAVEVNDDQPLRVVDILHDELKVLRGRRVAVLGLAFKPDTDDIRDAPSLKVVKALLREGAHVVAYDPQAEANARRFFHGSSGIEFAQGVREALKDADACIILTEWAEFSKLGAADFKRMRKPLVIEGRRILKQTRMPGVKYRGIGRLPHGK